MSAVHLGTESLLETGDVSPNPVTTMRGSTNSALLCACAASWSGDKLVSFVNRLSAVKTAAISNCSSRPACGLFTCRGQMIRVKCVWLRVCGMGMDSLNAPLGKREFWLSQ